MIALIYYIVISAHASAATAERQYAESLLRAKSTAEVERVSAAFDELRLSRLACHIQLRERAVPVSCYQALHLENRAHLHSAAQSRSLLLKLDKLCLEVHGGAGLPERPDVSPTCARHVALLRKVENYRHSGS